MPKQDVEVTSVTPELAAEWLLANTHNRSLRQRVILAYAADMTSGHWQWNGESVKFAQDGTLLDGQHRLAAIVESGVTLPLLVVRGLPNETQDTVDGGTKRKFSDVLKLRGEKSQNLLAAIIRRVTLWEMGIRKSGSSPYAPTNAEMLQTLEKYPDLRDVAGWAHLVTMQCSIPGSVLGLCMWLFAQIDTEDTSYFFERLRDGQALVKGDPIYELRRTAENTTTIRGQRSETFLLAITIKAWNAYRGGAQVGLLTYRPGGAKPEKFPEPR